MTTRRGILKLVGGGVVVAAAAAGGWYAMNGPSNEAREAWRQAGTPQDYRRRFLSYALLAPNPHNRQPWLVRLDGEDGLTLFCDLDRRLPETDPFDRQITRRRRRAIALTSRLSRMACRCRAWMSGLSQVCGLWLAQQSPIQRSPLSWTVARTGTRMTRARYPATC